MEDIVEVTITYFKNLFNASTCDQSDDYMQQIFSSDFTTDEIKAALF